MTTSVLYWNLTNTLTKDELDEDRPIYSLQSLQREDLGCYDYVDNDESQDPECSDGLDNDNDGMGDSLDPGCWTDTEDSSTYNPSDDDESDATSACQDGLDNDGDDYVDYPEDPGCTSRTDNSEYHKIRNEESDLYIANIRFGSVNGFYIDGPGAYFSITLENNGDKKMDDVKVGVLSDELGEYWPIGMADISRGRRSTMTRYLNVPGFAEPGEYDIRVVVSNDELRRVVYRTITII